MTDTLKIKSTNPKEQGPFVIIDKARFNPEVDELYEEPGKGSKPGKKAADGGAGDAK